MIRYLTYAMACAIAFATNALMPAAPADMPVGPFGTINDWLQIGTLGVDAQPAPAPRPRRTLLN